MKGALKAAMESGKVAGAALDVSEKSRPMPTIRCSDRIT